MLGDPLVQVGEGRIDLVWVVVPPAVSLGLEASDRGPDDVECPPLHLSLECGRLGDRGVAGSGGKPLEANGAAQMEGRIVGMLPDEMTAGEYDGKERPIEALGESEGAGAERRLDAEDRSLGEYDEALAASEHRRGGPQ